MAEEIPTQSFQELLGMAGDPVPELIGRLSAAEEAIGTLLVIAGERPRGVEDFLADLRRREAALPELMRGSTFPSAMFMRGTKKQIERIRTLVDRG